MNSSAWFRITLTTLLCAAVAWYVSFSISDIKYHLFANKEINELGDVLNLDIDSIDNEYVGISGVLGNRAATLHTMAATLGTKGPSQIRQMLGAHLFVMFDQEKYAGKYQAFGRVSVKGRLKDFGHRGRLAHIREFFRKNGYEVPSNSKILVVGESPGNLWPVLVAVLLLLVALSSIGSTVRRTRMQLRAQKTNTGV